MAIMLFLNYNSSRLLLLISTINALLHKICPYLVRCLLCVASPYLQERTCFPVFIFPPILFASLNSIASRRKTSMMESEKSKLAATNESVDNLGSDYGEPSNLQSEEDLRSLLTTLDKDQLVNILVKLGMKTPHAAEVIRGEARPPALHRKLFVHGFGQETTSETLCDAYSSYGEIVEGYVAADSATGKSRCFGFITFNNIESIRKALKKPSTLVDGREALHHPARERFGGAIASADAEWRRLHVAGLSSDITTEMLLRFFEKYGEIEEGSVISDKITKQSKGYGFVTFKTAEAAKEAITDPDKVLGGNSISVKHALMRQKGKEKQAQEPVSTYAPHIHHCPYAIASQRYGSSQAQVPPVHFSGYEPYGMPPAYQPPPAGFIAYPFYFF